jgi:hypothetical protein
MTLFIGLGSTFLHPARVSTDQNFRVTFTPENLFLCNLTVNSGVYSSLTVFKIRLIS